MPTRAEQVRSELARAVRWLSTPAFEPVHAGRWRHLASGVHVETGYCYGEGVVRLYAAGNRTETDRVTFLGSTDDFNNFVSKIPH